MRQRRSILAVPLVLVGLVAAAPATAAEPDAVVGHLSRPSTIRDYAGIQVVSVFDGGAYRLAIRRAGRLEQLPVAPSAVPFDVDIGPDRNGRPALVYTRCTRERAAEVGNSSTGCDLVVLALAGGGERPVRRANTGANEFAPTLWRGRIAFARSAKGRERPVVYTAEIDGSRSRPMRRVPGVPRRERAFRATDGHVVELELHGDRLAQILDLDAGGLLAEVRLVGIARRTSRELLRVGVGEGGQYFAGVGFAGGYVHWVYGWSGSGGGELIPGILRSRLSSGELTRADFPRIAGGQIVGLAPFAPDRAYMIDAQLSDDGCGEDLQGNVRECQLIQSGRLVFGHRLRTRI
jgi:hypothetical protein